MCVVHHIICMKKLSFTIVVGAVIICLSAISCEKQEGEGGTSSITGKVVVRQYNSNFTTLTETYYATDEDVFIIYGEDPVYGDKTTTNYDGTYRFDYLREGTYKIYAYSEDSLNYPTQHEIPVVKEVKITKRNQEVTVDNIVILK
jgi:hypothetical protein